MFPYIVVYIFALFLYNLSNNRKPLSWIYSLLALFLIAGLAGLRDGDVGTDTNLYVIPVFEDAVSFQDNFSNFYSLYALEMGMDWFYLSFNYVIALFSNSINFYLFMSHVLIIGITMLGIKISRVNVTQAMFIFLFAFMAFTLNGARQSMALSFCLLAFAMLREGYKKRWVGFIMVIAIGAHYSSILFIGILLMYKAIEFRKDFFSRNIVKIISILGIILILFSFSMILIYLIDFGIIKEFYIERYGSEDMYGTNIPISIIALTGFNLILFYYCKYKSHKIKDTVFLVFSEYILFLSVLLCGSALISTYAVRINYYFIYLSIIIIPYFLSYAGNKILITIFILFYLFYWILTVVVANLSNTFPYKSNILGI